MAGTYTKGSDGIVKIASGAEIPCLVGWALNASATIQKAGGARCMKSNGDDVLSGWNIISVLGRGWQGNAKFAWQATDEGASASFAPDQVGETLSLTLYPAGVAQRAYSGEALLANVSKPATLGEHILQTVTFIGAGELFELAPGTALGAYLTLAGDPYTTLAGDPYVTL